MAVLKVKWLTLEKRLHKQGPAPMAPTASVMPRMNYDMEVVLYQPKEFEDSKPLSTA